jgi:polyhydroxybutyrate depolymerase
VNRFLQAIALFSLSTLFTIYGIAAEPMQLVVNGQARTFLLERPVAQGPRPTIIMLHGAGSTAANIAQDTGLAQLAPREGLVAVFPEGRGSRWNWFPPGEESAKDVQFFQQQGGLPDDVAFLKILVADLVRRGVSDPKRI